MITFFRLLLCCVIYAFEISDDYAVAYSSRLDMNKTLLISKKTLLAERQLDVKLVIKTPSSKQTKEVILRPSKSALLTACR